MWQHAKLSDVSLGARLRYSLVVDEDVKKPNKPNQTHYAPIEIFVNHQALPKSPGIGDLRFLPEFRFFNALKGPEIAFSGWKILHFLPQ